MTREPVATTQTQQVRVVFNVLTNKDFFIRFWIVRMAGGSKSGGSRKARLLTSKIMALYAGCSARPQWRARIETEKSTPCFAIILECPSSVAGED